MKKAESSDRKPGRHRFWREVRGYAEALAVAFVFVTFVLNTVGVVGASMLPTLDGGPGSSQLAASLLTGDRVLVSKYHNWLVRAGLLDEYAAGEVVVLREPRSSPDYELRKSAGCFESLLVDRCRPFLIKRVAAAPGDSLSIAEGVVILNREPLDQSFITGSGQVEVHPVNFPVVIVEDGQITAVQVGWRPLPGGLRAPVLPAVDAATGFTPMGDAALQQHFGSLLANLRLPESYEEGEPVLASIRIPEGSYFVMGDNRSEFGSLDSRAFGLVPAVEIAGPASAVLWPPRRAGEWNWRLLDVPEPFREAAR